MSFHTDFETWQRISDPRFCPVCNQEPMPEGMVDVVELSNTWLCANRQDCLRGACHLIAKQHVIELFDLDDAALLPLMKEISLCARAIKTVSGAVRMNYEIHGNSTPHLHVHLYPRYIDDPFPGQPIDYHQVRDWYGGKEKFEAFLAALRAEING